MDGFVESDQKQRKLGELMMLKGLLWGAVVKEEYQKKRTVNSILDTSVGLSMGLLSVDSYITLE